MKFDILKHSDINLYNSPSQKKDTPENRQQLIDTASDAKNFSHTKHNDVHCFKETLPDGRQVWVEVRNNTIQNGGINNVPK